MWFRWAVQGCSAIMEGWGLDLRVLTSGFGPVWGGVSVFALLD